MHSNNVNSMFSLQAEPSLAIGAGHLFSRLDFISISIVEKEPKKFIGKNSNNEKWKRYFSHFLRASSLWSIYKLTSWNADWNIWIGNIQNA